MKIYMCVMCLIAAGSANYPGDIKMERLGIVTTDFAHRFHQKILVSDTNSVFSPVSPHMIMTNVELGARGANLDEMIKVLQLDRFDGGQYKSHEAYSNLCEQYRTNTTDGTVLVANGIFVVNATVQKLVPKFVNSTQTYNISDLFSIDLTNSTPGPEQKVNDHFKNKTKGLIQNIVKTGDINNSSKIVLVSAVTVAAQWFKPFSSKTKRESFYITPKTTIQVDYLYDDDRVINLKENYHGADIAELLLRGNRFSVVFLSPRTESSLAEQVAYLTAENRSKELFKGFKPQRCSFWVPKVRLESTFELSSAFKGLGMAKAFDLLQGDFTALIRTGGYYISKHFHKAVVEFNENGTAAVPSLAYTPPSSGLFDFLTQGGTFKLNDPFLWFLRDNKFGITLLQGKYTGK